MKDFRVVSFGNMKISLKGNFLIDWFSEFFVNNGDSMFHGPINTAISNEIKQTTQKFVDNMNQYKSDDSYNLSLEPSSQCFV